MDSRGTGAQEGLVCGRMPCTGDSGALGPASR